VSVFIKKHLVSSTLADVWAMGLASIALDVPAHSIAQIESSHEDSLKCTVSARIACALRNVPWMVLRQVAGWLDSKTRCT